MKRFDSLPKLSTGTVSYQIVTYVAKDNIEIGNVPVQVPICVLFKAVFKIVADGTGSLVFFNLFFF